jgi:hypothetical protein
LDLEPSRRFRIMSKMLTWVIFIVVLVLVGCSAPATQLPATRIPATVVPTTVPTDVPTATATPTEEPTATLEPTAAPTLGDLFLETRLEGVTSVSCWRTPQKGGPFTFLPLDERYLVLGQAMGEVRVVAVAVDEAPGGVCFLQEGVFVFLDGVSWDDVPAYTEE